MKTDQIRDIVGGAVEHERQHGALRRVVRAAYQREEPGLAGHELDERAEATVKSLTAFIRSMPDVVDATIAAAEKAGVAEDMRPIFQTAISYVHEEVDFIPDAIGLAGLIDDAYLVHGLMQEISHRHRALVGRDLLPESYFAETQRVRRMIGEPTATRLDVAIVAFARRHNVRQTIQQIFERIGSNGMVMDLPVTVAFGGGDALDEVPNLELGSLGE